MASNKQQKCIIISNLALFWLKLNKMCLELNYVLILVIIPSFGRLSDLTENKFWQIKFYFSQIMFYFSQLHSYVPEILFTGRLCLTSSAKSGQKSYTHQQFQLFWQKGTLTIWPNMTFLLHFSENYLCLMNRFECLIQNL